MVKVSILSVGDPGLKSQPSHTSDLKTGILAATQPDALLYRVSAKLAGLVSIL